MQNQPKRKAAGRCYTVAVILMLAIAEARAQQNTTENASQRRLVVSIPDRKLALVEDGEMVKVYHIGVGAKVSPSPTGTFKVVSRISEPTYYHPGVVIPAGADNPLGTRWIGLDHKGYGIHGTNVESSIGKAASHGCIRMHRQDIEELFADLQVGDQVEIRAAADPEIKSIFGEEPAAERESDGLRTAAAAEPTQQ